MLRGFVNTEWDRINGLDQEAAWRELEQMTGGKPGKATETTTITLKTPEEKQAYARRLLGVAEAAPYDEIRKAFERLNTRSDPKNFPAGSEEAKQALDIHKRVNWAYGVLTENMDTTEKRFRNLEI